MVALLTTRAGSPQHQAQQLHLSEAPLQTQPWARVAEPTGQQEQQLFLQEGHLQVLRVPEPAQLQEPPVGQEQFRSIWRKSEVLGPEQVASRSTGPVGGVSVSISVPLPYRPSSSNLDFLISSLLYLTVSTWKNKLASSHSNQRATVLFQTMNKEEYNENPQAYYPLDQILILSYLC